MYFFYYIPVGTDAGVRRFPVMTVFFAALCALVFALVRFGPDDLPVDFYRFIYVPGRSGWDAALAAAFLHFGWMHLIGNLVYLGLFGPPLESRLGGARFALLYGGAAVFGNVAQGVWNGLVLHTGAGIIGASGAVSGVLGAYLVRLPRTRIRVAWWVFTPLLAWTRAGRSEVPAVFAVALWVLLQAVRGALQTQGAAANVAHITHLAGFAFGAAFVALGGGWRAGREEALWMRARRALRGGDAMAALDALSEYSRRRPDDGAARAALARVRAQVGDRLGALAAYAEAIDRLLDAGRRGEAEAVYAEACRADGTFALSPERHLDLAFGLERNLKPEDALRAYETFAARYPDHPEAPFALLRAANLHAGTFARPGRAGACYRRLVQAYPGDAWADFAREQVRRLGTGTDNSR